MRSLASRLESLAVVFLLLAVTAVLYGHTLQVPFYLDDHVLFAKGSRLCDLAGVLRGLFAARGLSDFSFALNYRLTGWAPAPLHLVNIALHAACGVLVWRLLRQLLHGRWLPLLGALLFVAHPLQTEAVTYLAQRATVLAAFCVLLAMLLFLRGRRALAAGARRGSAAYLLPYCGALLAGGCAVLAKENTATLPLLLIAYDRLFPLPVARSRRQALFDHLPFFVVPALVGVGTLYGLLAGSGSAAFGSELVSLRHNGPLHYLVTQFSVLWVYLRLVCVPLDQALLHNYPVAAELFTGQNALALSAWLAVLWLAWRVRRRQPLAVFGLAWFLLALAVESSVIPLDPLFEHRLYLPLFGLLLVLLDALPALLGERRTLILLGVALLLCLPLTWQRNFLWNDPLVFYEDNLRVAPESERVLEYLGTAYGARGDYPRALELLNRALAINPGDASVYTNLGAVHAWMGEHRRAADFFARSLAMVPGSEETLFDYASTLFTLGEKEKAFDTLRTLVRLYPGNGEGQFGLGTLALEFGRRAEAEAARDALRGLGEEGRARELDSLLEAALPDKNR